jgi:hypothetical protein
MATTWASLRARLGDQRLATWKIAALLSILAMGATVGWSISHWNERRGVVDDVCYLRQAYLFQKSGWRGLDTDVAHEDGWLSAKLKEIGHPSASDVRIAPCHTTLPATGKRVMWYPPGTGFLLAAFPEGFQVVPLYLIGTTAVLVAGASAVLLARSAGGVAAAGLFACAMIYCMINPGKSSYSLPPTVVICALVGFLTIVMFEARRLAVRLAAAASAGLLLGLSVNLRLANAFLAAGYMAMLAWRYVRVPRWPEFLQGALFGSLWVIAIIPTLVANAVNTGHLLKTTYGDQDATLPDFGWRQVGGHLARYFHGTQGVLIASAIAATVLLCVLSARLELRHPGLIVAILVINLAGNMAFFLSHAGFTHYYAVPLAMLTLWTALFAMLHHKAEKTAGFAG